MFLRVMVRYSLCRLILGAFRFLLTEGFGVQCLGVRTCRFRGDCNNCTSVPLCPSTLGVSLSNQTTRKKDTLIINGLLGNLEHNIS